MPTASLTLAQTLPEGGMIPLFIALVGGFALWMAGVKIVRIVFTAIGAAVGGFTGAVLIPLTGLPAFDLGAFALNPGFTGLIIGGIAGVLVSMAMLRVVITFTAAAAFAVAGAMGALVFLHFSPSNGTDEGYTATDETETAFDMSDEIRRRAAEEATDALNRLNEDVSQDPTASGLLEGLNTEENRERLRAAAERSREFLSNASEAVRAEFDRRPDRDKLVILSATMAALGLGLLVGVTMPSRSSALVTSLFGSAVWLGAGVALLRANSDPAPGFLQQSPTVWAAVWGVIAVIGMVIQFGLIRRRAAKKASGEPEGE